MKTEMDIRGDYNAEELLKSGNQPVRFTTLILPGLNEDLAICKDINPTVRDVLRERKQKIRKRENFLSIDVKVTLRRRPIVMNNNRLRIGAKDTAPSKGGGICT